MKKRPLQLAATVLQLLFTTATGAADSQTTDRVSEAVERDAVDALPRTAFFETDAATGQQVWLANPGPRRAGISPPSCRFRD